MKKLKEGRIYQTNGKISVFRGYQGGAFIFTALNKAAKEWYHHYGPKEDPQYPLKNPRNWGKLSERYMEEVPFWPSLYWKFKALLARIL